MKKVIFIASAITLIGMVPLIHQEITGCAAFGYNHLTSPAVITSADSCVSSILAVPLIPSVQFSRLLPLNSSYVHYFFLGISSILIYTIIGHTIIKMKRYRIS